MNTGDEYFDSQEFQNMLASYEQAVSTGEPVLMDADELSEIADYYQMQGQADDAEKAIRLALSLSPGAIAPLTYRIHEALYEGDVEKAKDYLGQITETDAPDYVYDRAEVLLAEGKIDEADRLLRDELMRVPPEEYQDYVIDVATLYQDWGVSDKAMEWMIRAKQEDSLEYKELKARTLFGLGKYQDSEKVFNELIDCDPYQKRYWNALASVQFMREDFNGSVQSSEYAIAIDPNDPEGLIAKANALYRLGNYEVAYDYYSRYIRLVPDDEFAYLHQATTLINLERNDEAIRALEQAKTIAEENAPSPYLADIYTELAFAYSEQGDHDKAVTYINMTDELDCDHTQMLVIKGHLSIRAGRLEDAVNYFKQALEESDDKFQTHLRIIVSIYDNTMVEAAYKLFKHFFKAVPPDFNDGYAYMAQCCYDLKKGNEFMHYLKLACKKNPQEARLILSHLFPGDVAPENYYDYLKNLDQ